MAKDDFHVIVCKILSYLYKQLKSGEEIDVNEISVDSSRFDICVSYWEFIMRNLKQEGLVDGVYLLNAVGRENPAIKIRNISITPKGIEYLQDNSSMAKAREYLSMVKDIKDIIFF